MLWMETAVSQLPAMIKDTPKVLIFVSSLGMIQNGDYVDFNLLQDLLTKMSNAESQKDLQKMQI